MVWSCYGSRVSTRGVLRGLEMMFRCSECATATQEFFAANEIKATGNLPADPCPRCAAAAPVAAPVAVDTTKLDHDLNAMYRDYYERYGNWWNPRSELTHFTIVPTFEQFIASEREAQLRPEPRLYTLKPKDPNP